MTTVSSCKMIEALMYGMIPSAKIEKRSSAPPENKFTRPKTEPCACACWKKAAMASLSIPGVGTATPTR